MSLTLSICAQILFDFICYPGYKISPTFLCPVHLYNHLYPAFGIFIRSLSVFLCPKTMYHSFPFVSYMAPGFPKLFFTYAGKQDKRFDSIDGVEVRRVPEEQESKWLKSFGTFDGGGELMSTAWDKMDNVFAVR